jgi:hypothetical protein
MQTSSRIAPDMMAAVAAAIDPAAVERSLELLHPEFRVRLERVVTRMEVEFGHQVKVVETLRHQTRQNHLYEQGRTRPGEVVTWTRSSNHSTGLAADVIIDGTYGNPTAYSRLHRIAADEGLRTLGQRDPGHLELPARGSAPVNARAGTDTAGETDHGYSRPLVEPGAPHMMRAAGSESLARPAPVAPLAEVALAATPALARVAATAVPNTSKAPAGTGNFGGRPTPRLREDSPVPTGRSGPAPDIARPAPAFAMTDIARIDSVERPTASVLSSGSAERIAHLLDLQSSAPVRPLSQVFLRVDGPGGEDRIRLGMRGTAVGATIDVGDLAAANRLQGRLGELQRALEAKGLEAESLRVRSTPRADTVEISRLALSTAEPESARPGTSRGSSESSHQRDRAHDSHRDEPEQRSPDPRHRSPREQKGGHDT